MIRDSRPEDRFPCGDGSDGSEDPVPGGPFDEIPAGSGRHRGEHGLVVLQHRQHQYGDLWRFDRESPSGIDSADAWHVDVEQRHVRHVLHRKSNGLATICRDAHQVDILGVGTTAANSNLLH